MMKKLLVTLIVLFSTTAFAQTIDLKNKEWYSRGQIGAAPPTWNAGEYAHILSWQNPANNLCMPQSDANCNLNVAPGAGIIWEVRVRDGNGATLADLTQLNGGGPAVADFALNTMSVVSGWNTAGANWSVTEVFNAQQDNITNDTNGMTTTTFLYGYDGATWDRLETSPAGDALGATEDGLDVIGYTHYYDGNNFRRWLGATHAADGLGTDINSPWVGNFNYVYDDDGNWDRMAATNADDGLGATLQGVITVGLNHFYDGTNYRRWQGAQMNTETLANTSYSPWVQNFNYAYDAAGATWRWVNVINTQADNQATTLNGLVTSSILYGYDGATFDMVRIGASGEVQMTDVATRPGEDSGNDWRKTKKEEIAEVVPAATTGTAVDDAGTDIILASREIINDANFCVWVKNAGGGSGDNFSDVDVSVSPDDTEWVDLGWTDCDTIASGVTCVYCVAGNAYRYVRVIAACAGGEDTTADAWYTANKG
jgi:hypothetical protein